MKPLVNFISGAAIRLVFFGGTIPEALAIGLLCVVVGEWWDFLRAKRRQEGS